MWTQQFAGPAQDPSQLRGRAWEQAVDRRLAMSQAPLAWGMEPRPGVQACAPGRLMPPGGEGLSSVAE